MLGFAARMIGGTLKVGGRMGWDITKGAVSSLPAAAKAGWYASAFTIRHPYFVAGAVGATAYAATRSGSPYSSPSLGAGSADMRLNVDSEQAAIEAMNTGIAPMGSMVSGAVVRNQRLMESTYGLTQGLHRSRH